MGETLPEPQRGRPPADPNPSETARRIQEEKNKDAERLAGFVTSLRELWLTRQGQSASFPAVLEKTAELVIARAIADRWVDQEEDLIASFSHSAGGELAGNEVTGVLRQGEGQLEAGYLELEGAPGEVSRKLIQFAVGQDTNVRCWNNDSEAARRKFVISCLKQVLREGDSLDEPIQSADPFHEHALDRERWYVQFAWAWAHRGEEGRLEDLYDQALRQYSNVCEQVMAAEAVNNPNFLRKNQVSGKLLAWQRGAKQQVRITFQPTPISGASSGAWAARNLARNQGTNTGVVLFQDDSVLSAEPVALSAEPFRWRAAGSKRIIASGIGETSFQVDAYPNRSSKERSESITLQACKIFKANLRFQQKKQKTDEELKPDRFADPKRADPRIQLDMLANARQLGHRYPWLLFHYLVKKGRNVEKDRLMDVEEFVAVTSQLELLSNDSASKLKDMQAELSRRSNYYFGSNGEVARDIWAYLDDPAKDKKQIEDALRNAHMWDGPSKNYMGLAKKFAANLIRSSQINPPRD